MSAMRRTRALWMLGCALACVGACSSGGGGEPPLTGRFTQVFLSVNGVATARSDGKWESARVSAVVTDRDGRRTGWTVEGQLREIVGCGLGFGWEEGIPTSRPDDADTAGVAAWERSQADTVQPDEPEPHPIYHYFHIARNDAVVSGGLIDQGGCDLELDPIVAGKVQLSLSAEGGGFSLCKDTTSTWVRLGVPLRWRLSWKATGEECIVKISPIATGAPSGGKQARPRVR